MEKLQMCRICLVENVRMYVVVNKNLHVLYEKLTDIPFVTEDRRPILACLFCCTKLKQCWRLLRKCLEAEEQFAQMMNVDYESNFLINQDRLEFCSGFIKSPIEHISIVDECQTESIAIKEEILAVCEGLHDIIEPKEEHQSEELEPENLDNSCLDVADIPPQHSESELEDYKPLMEFKTEVEEEVSKKKLKATEITKTDVKIAAPKKAPRRMKVRCGVGSTLNKDALCTSTASETPKPKAFCVFDLHTKKSDTIMEQWLQEEDDDSLHEANDLEFNVACTELESAHIPDDLNPEAVEWLAQEDTEADLLLRQMASYNHLSFDWSGDHNTFVGQREIFTGFPGPTFAVDHTTRPSDVFLKFFDDQLFDVLVDQTNRHSAYVIDKHLTTKTSRLNFWVNTDRSEMAVFFATMIFQGLVPLTVEKDYWRENGYLTLKYFRELMTYNRYVLIKRMIHFADNVTGRDMTSDASRLRKIQPVLDHLNSKYSSLYYPGRDIAIDESLLKWHGRLSFAQKIATKAAKVGVKSYELCESSTGYLWKFFFYTGKGQTDDMQTDDRQADEVPSTSRPPAASNATARIVYDLAKPLLNRGHTLIMDNFYNSPLLARYLKSHGTDCYGTLRVNREFVPESIKSVAKNELRVGEILHSYCRDLSVMLWRDTNVVAMLSTFHKGEVAGKEKYGRYKYKPQVVLDYNLSMGGVDRKDQLLSSHPMERSRNQVWYKKVFRRLLNVTILNSYIIYKSFYKTVNQRAFRQRLAEELVQRFQRPAPFPIQVVTKCLPSGPGMIGRPILSGNHFVGTGTTKNARCIWCKKSRSKYICKQCDVTLCLEICFEEFHTVRRDSNTSVP